MTTEIIELDTWATINKHATGNNWFKGFLSRTFGLDANVVFADVFDGIMEGMVEKDGKYFDIVWNGEKYKALEAE